MPKKAIDRGPSLIEALVHALRGPSSPVGEAVPLDAAALLAAEKVAQVALSPSLAALFLVDVGWMRRTYGWFDAKGNLLARPLAELVAEHAGAMAEGFEEVLARFPGMALPCDAGSDSARFLYLGDPDDIGEYPVVGIDHDDLPCMDVAAAGFDVWLAAELGVAVSSLKAANDAANKRVFGKKAGWSIDAPGRIPKPVAGPAPGSVAHAPLPAPAKQKAPRKLTDKQLDKALAERAEDGDLARLGELIADATARKRPRAAFDDALIAGAKGGHDVVVRALLAAGASPDAKEYYGHAISRAVVYRSPPIVVETLLAAGARADAASVNGRTALFEAVEQKNVEVAQMLLDHGADVNRGESNRMRPLHHAAAGGDLATTTLLLDRGADVDGGDHFRTPLLLAVEQGRDEVVALLVARHADVRRPSEYLNATPLHVAFEHGRAEIAKALIQAGADRAATDDRGISLEGVFGPAGDDIAPLVLPTSPETGEVHVAIDLCVLNPTGLAPTSVNELVLAHRAHLAAAGLAGPTGRLSVSRAGSFDPQRRTQRIEGTLTAREVAPEFFGLFARALRKLRVALRVTGVHVEGAGPTVQGDAARAHLASLGPPPAPETRFPVALAKGDAALVFELARPMPAPEWNAPVFEHLRRAGLALSACSTLWPFGPAYGLAATPSMPSGRSKTEVTQLEVALSWYDPSGKAHRTLPWKEDAMRAALKCVSARVHEAVSLASATLRVGR